MGDLIIQFIYLMAIFCCGALIGEKYGAGKRRP